MPEKRLASELYPSQALWSTDQVGCIFDFDLSEARGSCPVNSMTFKLQGLSLAGTLLGPWREPSNILM